MPLFALVAWALLGVFRTRSRATADPNRGSPSPLRDYATAALAAIALGGVTELVQIPVGRDASWTDFWHDGLGIAVALGLCAAFDRRFRFRPALRAACIALCIIALTPIAVPIVRVARAYAYRASLWPRLADFSTDRDSFWTVGVGARRVFKPGALEIEFVGERYPGVSWFEPQPDWSGYQTLVLEIENPSDQAMELTLRVHDRQHHSGYTDRFNREFSLASHERRTIRVSLDDIAAAPRGRRMDLTHIAGLAVFRSGPPGPSRMIIYALRLEAGSPSTSSQ